MMEIKTENAFRKNLWSWVRFALLMGAILYFFAPASWWQFGVTSVDDRKSVAEFKLKPLQGENSWKFTDHRGKVLLVNYWATWCAPCRFEMPGLVSISKEFEGQDFAIVGVTVDEDLAAVPPFIKKYAIDYPILLPGNDPNLGSGGITLPTTFLYDKNGRLAKKYTGIVLESTLRSDIKSLLNE
ncbi:MAG: TlpA family protein disulfide reductase [Acidobacteria bacterium]|nr:TlpA family protein disulfide reductase [Acidobacteriota bacterium]